MKREQIDEILRDKLYDMEPEAGVLSWEKFEPRLKRKTTPRYRWISVGASIAATIAIVILLTNPLEKTSEKALYATVEPTKQTTVSNPTDATNLDNHTSPILTKALMRKHTIKQNNIDTVSHNLKGSEQKGKSEIATRLKSEDQTDKTIDAADQKPEKEAEWVRKNWRSGLEKVTGRERRNRKISLLAYSNIPNGVKGADGVPVKYNTFAQTATLQQAGSRRDIITFKDSDMTHKFPLTFGVSVSIPLNDKFAIESGLTYTYLESSAEISKGFRYKYTQKVEYLGIPLSATYKFIDTRYMDIYGSVGVMGEVALSATGKTEAFDLFHSESDNKDIAACGVQVSANAAVGVNVHVTNKIGIYFEPGISNYFKNSNQPSTARSQSAFQFNMRAGFKIQL